MKDRGEFLKIAGEAYGAILTTRDYKTEQAQLLLAYHKDAKNIKEGFPSNNQSSGCAASRGSSPSAAPKT